MDYIMLLNIEQIESLNEAERKMDYRKQDGKIQTSLKNKNRKKVLFFFLILIEGNRVVAFLRTDLIHYLEKDQHEVLGQFGIHIE